MSIDELESSAYRGAPRQLFLFSMGEEKWGYCASELPHTHLSFEYQPESIDMDPITQSLSESSPTINIKIHPGAAVCQQFVAYQPIKPMRVRVYRYHEWDTDGEYAIELIGDVVSSAFTDSSEERECVFLVKMMASYVERTVPWPVFQKQCNRAPYSPSCGVNVDAFKVEVTVLSVIGDEITDPALATYPDGWFRAGYVVTPRGETRFIAWHEGDKIVLQTPLVDASNGDEMVFVPGCDLLRTTCHTKFNNFPRWLGFGWIPEKNPFTDNVFGTGGSSTSGSGGTSGRGGFMLSGGS